MSHENLRKQLEDLLPTENPKKTYIILSIGCGDNKECIEAILIGAILAVREITNFVYHGIDSSQNKVSSHQSRKDKEHFKFHCNDASHLNPVDMGLKNNSVDLVILRHPRFELFLPSDLNYGSWSLEQMLACFKSEPMLENPVAPYLIVPTKKDIEWLSLDAENARNYARLDKNMFGVFRDIIELTIPKFIAEDGQLFATCYQKHEMAAVLHFSRAYCLDVYTVGFDKANPKSYGSRVDGSSQIHYTDGYFVTLTENVLFIKRNKERRHAAKYGEYCGSGFFRRVAGLFATIQNKSESESINKKFK